VHAHSQPQKKINPAELRGLGKKITGTSYLPFLKAFRHRQKIFTTNNHYEWSKDQSCRKCYFFNVFLFIGSLTQFYNHYLASWQAPGKRKPEACAT
jgi:hypothetical protein